MKIKLTISVNIQSVTGFGDIVLFHNGLEWKFELIRITIETCVAEDISSATLEKDKICTFFVVLFS